MKTLIKFINSHKDQFTTSLILCVAIFGVVEILQATPFGPGVGSDSVVYITSARNLLTGHGLGLINPDGTFRLLPYFPPFYPLVLSTIGLFIKDLVSGARWLNALLFGGLIALVGLEFHRYTRSGLFGLALSCLLAVSTVLIRVSAWAMSEPVSLLTGFGGLFLLLKYLGNHKSVSFIFSALLVGLAFLSRYAMVAACLTGSFIILLFLQAGFWKRTGQAVAYGLLSILPMAIWFLVDYSTTGTLGSRSSQTISDLTGRASGLILPLKESFYNWTPFVIQAARAIGQPWFRIVLATGALLLVLAVSLSAMRIRKQNPKSSLNVTALAYIATVAIFGVLYLLMIAGTYIFTYPPITLSDRMFSPLLVVYLISLMWIGFIINMGFQSKRWIPYLVIIVVLGFVGNYAVSARKYVKEMSGDGQGYNAWVYRHSALIEYVQSLPEDTPLITNKAPMILYFTGRPAYTIQEVFSPKELANFLPYGFEQEDEAQRVFREDGGALILFNSIVDDFIGLYGEETGLTRYSLFVQGLTRVFRADDGQVYYFPASQ
jgi:hypothetical protein